ncbi:MAG: GPW/gp25 family protein [Saprospiraceae bacterium]|nr:GPW/gp25 family protein [Saprospiraceae bacterium]
MSTDRKFTGTGWGFPPTFEKTTKGVVLSSDVEDIEQSLRILLGTLKGERVMHPSYGCNLNELLFESYNLTIKNYIIDLVKTAILFYEARIEPLKVSINEAFIHEGQVVLEIEYLVRSTNSRFNMVYPFYINEGIEIQQLIKS